jgi:hypothetical protein
LLLVPAGRPTRNAQGDERKEMATACGALGDTQLLETTHRGFSLPAPRVFAVSSFIASFFEREIRNDSFMRTFLSSSTQPEFRRMPLRAISLVSLPP